MNIVQHVHNCAPPIIPLVHGATKITIIDRADSPIEDPGDAPKSEREASERVYAEASGVAEASWVALDPLHGERLILPDQASLTPCGKHSATATIHHV